MKPKAQNEHEEGLLEYLEDIIGTAQYKDQTELLGQKLETLNEERSQKLTRVRVVEKEKNLMTPQREEAEQFLKAENDLVIKKNRLLQLNVFECRRYNDVLNDSIVFFLLLLSCQCK
jgi:structural maintenance of chromosome 4